MQRCTFGLALFDIGHDLVALGRIDQRSEMNFRIERIAEPDGLRARGQAVEELLLDAALHENARAIGADLAGRIEIAEERAADGIFHIGVVENDQGRLAAEFHGGVLHVRAGLCQHALAGRDRAGQRDLGDQRVIDQLRADIAETLQHIEQTVGQARFLVDFSQGRGRRAGVFSEGLKIMALPAASAGADFQPAPWIG